MSAVLAISEFLVFFDAVSNHAVPATCGQRTEFVWWTLGSDQTAGSRNELGYALPGVLNDVLMLQVIYELFIFLHINFVSKPFLL